MEKAEQVERYYAEEHQFSEGINKLRHLALKTGLEETYKWMFPTYMIDGKNVVSICKFKKHFGIWFFDGVFLRDEKQVLTNAQKGKTQAMRHWKFYDNEAIDANGVLGYLLEAIENQKNGRVLAPLRKKKNVTKATVPDHLKKALAKDKIAAEAFKKLSQSSQNQYAEYIASAKLEKTKQTRLEKIMPLIADGKGIHRLYS